VGLEKNKDMPIPLKKDLYEDPVFSLLYYSFLCTFASLREIAFVLSVSSMFKEKRHAILQELEVYCQG
jgi:hypothetical protein